LLIRGGSRAETDYGRSPATGERYFRSGTASETGVERLKRDKKMNERRFSDVVWSAKSDR